jgi:hypothetical protein
LATWKGRTALPGRPAHWQQIGSPGPWANTLNSLGVIHYLHGEYDQALRLLNQALAKVREAGNLRVEAVIWASLGDVYRDLGAYEQARQAYADGVLIATRADEGFVITYTLDGLGNIFRLQRSLTQARNRLIEALGHAEQHNSTYEIGLCHTSLGILANEEGDLAAARRHLDRATELLQAGGFKRELARARLHRAQAAFLAEDQSTSVTDLRDAMSLADQLGFDQFLVVEGQHLQPMLRYAVQMPDCTALSSLLDRIEAHQSKMAGRAEPTVRAETQTNIKICTLGQARVELDGTSVNGLPRTAENSSFACWSTLRVAQGRDRCDVLAGHTLKTGWHLSGPPYTVCARPLPQQRSFLMADCIT